jgi:UDP-N-acetylmuramoyl-L-alanyl-D-glutamate--2,6-diaminopimelate ligase
MRLGALLGTDDQADVTGFAIDHRKVAPGTVFGAFRGARFNGEDFIGDAIKAGAVAIISAHGPTVAGAVHIASDEPRRDFALLAAKYFAPFPQTTVAVTGTNGKTSTVELTRHPPQQRNNVRRRHRPDDAGHCYVPVEHGGAAA